MHSLKNLNGGFADLSDPFTLKEGAVSLFSSQYSTNYLIASFFPTRNIN